MKRQGCEGMVEWKGVSVQELLNRPGDLPFGRFGLEGFFEGKGRGIDFMDACETGSQ